MRGDMNLNELTLCVESEFNLPKNYLYAFQTEYRRVRHVYWLELSKYISQYAIAKHFKVTQQNISMTIHRTNLKIDSKSYQQIALRIRKVINNNFVYLV